MPLSKCLKRKQKLPVKKSAAADPAAAARSESHVRLCEDVEHGDALGGLRRVQVVQRGHGVDHPEHHGRFHPVVHQVGISQAGCKGAGGGSVPEPDGWFSTHNRAKSPTQAPVGELGDQLHVAGDGEDVQVVEEEVHHQNHAQMHQRLGGDVPHLPVFAGQLRPVRL